VSAIERAARPLRLCLILQIALFGCPPDAAAHQINLSNARIELKADGVVELEIAMKGSDADRAVGTRVHDQRRDLVDPERLAASSGPIAAYFTAHAVVRTDQGMPCSAGPVALDADQDGVVAHFAYSCGATTGDQIYRSTVLVDLDPTARQVVLITVGPQVSQALLDADQNELRLRAPPPALTEVIARYTAAGVEHIFLGYDHIAFLIGIVLWARRAWPVIKIVTAFTIAHSITLSLAALNIVVLPSSIVEPAIAVTIVYVSLENFFSRNVDKRWRDTFAFGLIHGFGFASALQEFGLPTGAVVPALAAFNIGVEMGQVAIVSLLIPFLIGVDWLIAAARDARPARASMLVYALSGVIAGLGFYWLLERTLLE
jgi:hydrogenase/urease accessory protein HupE